MEGSPGPLLFVFSFVKLKRGKGGCGHRYLPGSGAASPGSVIQVNHWQKQINSADVFVCYFHNLLHYEVKQKCQRHRVSPNWRAEMRCIGN